MSDTTELQALFNAAAAGDGRVTLNPGRVYTIEPTGSNPMGVILPAGTPMVVNARGAIFQPVAGAPAAWSALGIRNVGAVVFDLQVDGSLNPSAAEHRHNVWVEAEGVTLRRVSSHYASGDGFYVYLNANFLTAEGCVSGFNGRNSFTFGASNVGSNLNNCALYGSHAQQLDIEPKQGQAVSNLRVTGCHIDAGTGTDYAVALGTGVHQTLYDCTVLGGVHIVNGAHILIDKLKGSVVQGDKAAVDIWRECTDVQIVNSNLTAGGKRAIWVVSTTGDGVPADIFIEGNTLAGHNGVEVNGALRTYITNNDIHGAALDDFGSGIVIRATDVNLPMEELVAMDNRLVGDWKNAIGVGGNKVGTQASSLNRLVTDANDFTSTRATAQTALAMDTTVKTYWRGFNNYGPSVLSGGIPSGVVVIDM